MLLIFSGSTDLLSTERTSRIVAPLLRWLKPDLSEAAIKNVQFILRKCGHVTEFAVLAVLFWRARRPAVVAPWNWTHARNALVFAALYAVSDEVHQYFVASRMASGWDVLIDIVGAAAGLFVLWRFGRSRQYW